MKALNLIFILICLFFLKSPAQFIQGYTDKISVTDNPNPKPKYGTSVKGEEKLIDSTTWFSPIVTTEKYDMVLLFKESFNNKSLDQDWTANSGTQNMLAYHDNLKGKVLKIKSVRPNGNSFIETDLTELLRGKNIRLQAQIKTKDIKIGGQSYEKGQLCIKYSLDGYDYYAAVQNLSGTSDWDLHFAHEDGSTPIDNTEYGPYVFHIPAKAKNIILYLGLQNCTGEIYFKNIEIYEVKGPMSN